MAYSCMSADIVDILITSLEVGMVVRKLSIYLYKLSFPLWFDASALMQIKLLFVALLQTILTNE
jgi:hypothetical protein